MYRRLLYILSFFSALYSCRSIEGKRADPLFLIVQNDRVGYINARGEQIIAPHFINGSGYAEGLMAVRENGRYGYIDRTGRYVIPPRFDYALPFREGLAIVNEDDRYYCIDTSGKQVFAAPYREIRSFMNGRAYIRTYGWKDGFINRHGQLVIDTLYNRIGPFVDGLAVAAKPSAGNSEQMGVIDTLGHIIVPFGKYDEINDFSDGYAIVKIGAKDSADNGSDGVIDRNGKLLFVRPRRNNCFIYGDYFRNGLAKMGLYKYWIPEEKGVLSTSVKDYAGYINLRNEIVLNDTTIDRAEAFSNGRAFVKKKDGEYYMIDMAMHRVGHDYYNRVQGDTFMHGYAIVYNGDGWGIIDTNARWVARPSFDDISEVGIVDGYFFYGKDTTGDKKLYGIAHVDSGIVLRPILEAFDRNGFVNGLLQAVSKDRLCYIDHKGKIIWQNRDTSSGSLQKLNIDYMLRGSYLAYSSPEKRGEPSHGGGWYISGNIPRKTGKLSFKPNVLSLSIDGQKTDTFAGRFTGHPLYLANTTTDTVRFNAEDSRLYMKLQARAASGQWKDIEYIPGSWCGNSYHTIALEPAHYWSFVIPDMEGELPVQLRVELKYIDKNNPKNELVLYSNEINGHINPAQWWRKEGYTPGGIMDPYLE